MKLALIVGIGSFFGGIFRYLLSTFIESKSAAHFPYGTFAVNISGCFIIGCLFGVFEKWQLASEWRLLFVTGLLGGFTTFSAFSIETFQLFKSGHTITGLIYIVLTIAFGISLTFLGVWIFRYGTNQL